MSRDDKYGNLPRPDPAGLATFKQLLEKYRYQFDKLVYVIFPFGEKGSALEFEDPYEWQMEEWRKMSTHYMDPKKRYELYRLIVSSGNGAAKTAFGAMTMIMLMFTQQLRGRVTANTDPQLNQVVWPEVAKWFRSARYVNYFFEMLGTSIRPLNEDLAKVWQFNTFTWHENNPTAVSGLHNKGAAVMYWFEEAPGIPTVIWDYAQGAFLDSETVKVWFAFGNSDDPESEFERNMTSPLWNARRIDTRELKYMDQSVIRDILQKCDGNEDHDDFRVRVRGLPRKTAKDSIINGENVLKAIKRGETFQPRAVSMLPVVLGCDPAWTGGDEITIWARQGNWFRLLDRFKLEKVDNDTHSITYQKLCYWERKLSADRVFIDQAEGTAVYTLAQRDQKYSWSLVAFGSAATDAITYAETQYGNKRAQMYYEAAEAFRGEAVITSEDPTWLNDVVAQMTLSRGSRHKTTGKKTVESKLEIKKRTKGKSPDLSDGLVLTLAEPVFERIGVDAEREQVGTEALLMPELPDPYASMDGL